MRTKLGIGVGVMALIVASAPPASAGDNVVADNLTSPLGFAVTDGGTLYVAEAFAGLLTKIAPNGTRTELASAPPGSGTAGVAKAPNGSVYYTLTLPPEQGSPPDTALAVVHPNGSTETLASLADYEAQNNPDAGNVYGILRDGDCYDDFGALSKFLGPARYSGQVESNPYAVAIEGYDSAIVADAAGNDIVRVVGGEVSTVAVLPPIKQRLTKQAVRKEVRRINRKLERRGKDPIARRSLDSCIGVNYASNPVPTDVEIGPDGHYYVSTLPGGPELPGYARVFRVNAATGAVRTVAKGFTGATDLAVAGDGTIYVAELFAFQVSTVAPGDRSATSSTFVDCPTAVEVNSAGDVYVARGGLCGPDPGEIITLG
ncbi:MAG TPA: ScyD/ScyE family protein [Actinomycetes bacterium]|nr:ScyD/ScyE family protein [Actinomycetes bacterium]